MGWINIAGIALAFGALGQDLLLGHLTDRVPFWLVFVPLWMPGLLVYVISFCKVAPCSPGRFAQLLIIAMVWYSIDTAVCELVWLLVPSARSHAYSAAVPHTLCYGCAVTFIVLIRGVRIGRTHHENDSESV